jgi:class 3 adenylate cyclase/tetratricopeptide (TPR) repeat protein
MGGHSTVIVLFTDLVGSTELRSQLGEEAAEQVRRQHDRLLADAIGASRGRLVKNLGDGVMATFGGASDAVTAAVRIQHALGRHNRLGAPARLEVRVGVSAGDVTFDEGDCFGTPVIEAARLCAAARGGQILVSEVVRWLAGSVGGHDFTPLGALTLKGLPAPVLACEVMWAPLAVSSVPLPPLLTEIGRIFVGRERELDRLAQLWKEAAAGELQLALLPGEPGVGKTRLAAELAQVVHDEGATVLAGRCDEDLGVPYQPFVEALRHYLSFGAELRLGRLPGELARLVPDLPETVPGLPEPLRSDPESERYRLFDGVASWLASVSADTPVLLILDDLQWAAKPTLLLLRHVLRFPEPARVFVVATYRDTDVGRGHPLADLLADLRRAGGSERLPLTGLDATGVAAFMEAAAGHGLDEDGEDLARAVWTETEGNPFFLSEVLRHLSEAGALERRDGRWVTTATLEEVGIPEGVRDVVGRRLSRLSEAANRALTVAAVTGLEFEPAVVAAASGMEEEELLGALEAVVAARLVSEIPGAVPRYRFSHALVRATVYDELTGSRRVALHRRVAEAIEAVYANRIDDHLPALAHHWARAAAPADETGKAVHYAVRAGDGALAQLAHDEAVAYYASALELLSGSGAPPDDARRVELLISLGEAQRRAGIAASRETLLEAAALAERRGDAGALARAALANHPGFMFSVAGLADPERLRTLETALAAIGPADSLLRARLLAILAVELFWAGDHAKRRRLSDEALAMARRLGDVPTVVAVLSARQYAIAAPHTVDQRLAETEELLAAIAETGDPASASGAWWTRTRVLVEAGRIDEAAQAVQMAFERAAESGQPELRLYPTWVEATLATFHGRLDVAEALTQRILSVGELCEQPSARIYHAFAEFQLRFEQGRLAEIEDSFRESVVGLPLVAKSMPLVATSTLAVLHCELGRDAEAQAVFRELMTLGPETFPVDAMWLRTTTDLAAVAAYLRDATAAAVLHGLLAPYPEQFPVAASITGCVSYYLGLLATTLERYDEAEARFAAAEATHERVKAPAWVARTRVEWAAMLLCRADIASRDAERARDLLGQALTTARQLSLPNVERRTVELLA